MSLTGDIIQGFRELAPDPSQTLQPPTFTATVDLTSYPPPGGGLGFSFGDGTIVYVKATQLTPWGETASLAEQTVTHSGSNFNISVVIHTSVIATSARGYYSINAGQEDEFYEVAFPAFGGYSITVNFNPVTLSIQRQTGNQSAMVPTISRAYNPDSDGNVCSAMLVYRWLNEGLKLAGQITGGIRDVTGLPAQNGQANYQIVGQWTKFDNNFFDGYPFPGGGKAEVFRHSNVRGLSGVGTCNMSADRQFVECWPQPNRTGGSTTMTYGCSATDTGIIVNGNTGWLLGFGLALIGTYPPTAVTGSGSCELVYYSSLSSSAFTQIQRGMGGTYPQTWPINTQIQECNIYFTGLRFPMLYQRGQSGFTFTNPPAYEDIIRTYMIHRFRAFEQDTQASQAEFERFRVLCEAVKNSRQPLGPRRIQAELYGGGSGVQTVVGAGSIFGGVILT